MSQTTKIKVPTEAEIKAAMDDKAKQIKTNKPVIK